MRINCWHEVGPKKAKKDVVRLRKIPAARMKELRAAIAAARSGEAEGLLFELERGYSDRGRAVARLAVGLGVVALMASAVAAFVVPDAAAPIFGFGIVPAAMVTGVTAWLSFIHDTGLRVEGRGILRAEGWGGITELELGSYARVTVADDPPNDVMWIEG